MSDSILHEVRSVREQHAASFDYDLDRIFVDLRARQKKHVAEGWLVISVPVNPPSAPGGPLQRVRFPRP